MYIAYQTLWSEGVIVAKTDDVAFCLGIDAVTGSPVYTASLDEFEKIIVAVTNEIDVAVTLDSALYHRKPIDQKEYELFNQLQLEYNRLKQNQIPVI